MLKGEIALVTGSTSEIGLGIAKQLAAKAAHLAMPGMRMRMRNCGRIIDVASVHGMVGSAGKSTYIVAKHGAWVTQ